jgi:hypothetical protein
MVTLRQLKAERKRAFRAVLRSLNPAEKSLNELHRELVRRLRKHNVELLDAEDATKIAVMAQALYKLVNALVGSISGNLDAFFR